MCWKYIFSHICDFQTLDPWFPLKYAPVSTPSSYCIGYRVIKDKGASYWTKYTSVQWSNDQPLYCILNQEILFVFFKFLGMGWRPLGWEPGRLVSSPSINFLLNLILSRNSAKRAPRRVGLLYTAPTSLFWTANIPVLQEQWRDFTGHCLFAWRSARAFVKTLWYQVCFYTTSVVSI